MKKITAVILTIVCAFTFAQAQFVTTPQASPEASVSQRIGLTKVTIDYHRPGVKGREGKIYGENGLVPYNDGKPFPWRAGANENTTISFEDDVKIQGKDLPAGKYGFHVIPAEEEWTIIFSNNNYSWGSFNYDASEDALRVTAKPQDNEMVEWLEYRFVNQTDHSADIELSWEKKKVVFTVDVDVHEVTKESIAQELDGLMGFTWQGLSSAASYFLNAEKDLEIGLKYAERATGNGFGAQKNFTTLQTKAQILEKLGRTAEAEAVTAEALPLATVTELHFYGRSLIQKNQPQKALEVFKMNREKHPNDNFTTFVGLARGNMAVENYEKAAKYFRKAAPNAPQGQAQVYEGLAKKCDAKLEEKG